VRLYHYACGHSVRKILDDRGTLRPNPFAGRQLKLAEEGFDAFAYPVVWLTDVAVRSRDDALALGLGGLSGVIECNRVEFRFVVPKVGVVTWESWADAHALEWGPPGYRELLEAADGADPARWWVAAHPVSGARLDENYKGVAV
jgi:hypothetical protein